MPEKTVKTYTITITETPNQLCVTCSLGPEITLTENSSHGEILCVKGVLAIKRFMNITEDEEDNLPCP